MKKGELWAIYVGRNPIFRDPESRISIMSEHSHAFIYNDIPDFISQLEAMALKLRKNYGKVATLSGNELIPYHQVRIQYPHLSDSAFTMRLKRFKGTFPHERGPKGEKIIKLFVTRALDAYLRK